MTFHQILASVPFFNEENAYELPLATCLQQRSGPVPGEGFAPCGNCSKWNIRGASCLERVPFRNAVGRAAKAKNNDRDPSNLAAEMKKYNSMFITSLAGISLMPA